jgi:FlaA1/EpsC-like NDP-sugar epimerase
MRYAQAFLRKHRWFIGIFQASLICFSLMLAWMLRFDYTLPDRAILLSVAPILVPLRLLAVWRFGLLHGWWRYTGASDVMDVFKAVSVGSLAFIIAVHYVLRIHAFPRSIYLLEPLLTFGLLVGVRLFSRLFAETVRQDLALGKKILLIGAGAAAQLIVHESKRPNSGFTVLGCLDDDPSKSKVKVGGVAVLGAITRLPEMVDRFAPDEVLIAVPSATGKQMQRFVQICEQAGVKFRTLPPLLDVIHGQVTVNQFRDVRLEDLLGREPRELDLDAVKQQIAHRIVLVTGAAGSIGSELCRQILLYQPRCLICADQSETGMFFLEREFSSQPQASKLKFIVADIGDRDRMYKVFSELLPEMVFHAAAYKHVPVMEANVAAAVSNNVFALMELLEVAEENGCGSFVLISSDKAVNPSSTMGATKRLGELIISQRPLSGMRAVSVRFGNVLGSSGSVIPVLQEQLRSGRPLTITHPDMKRFFMTTREAVSLVLQASAIGEHGETLVLDMGEPVKILDLARTLIKLSGKREEDVEIQFGGLRPGEKLIEELFYACEIVSETCCPKIKRVSGSQGNWAVLVSHLDELRGTLYVDGASPIRAKIKQIVPEYFYSSDPDSSVPFAEIRKAAIGA